MPISTDTIIFIQIISSIWMTSLIWVIQCLHYPFFNFIETNKTSVAHKFHTSKIFWLVFPAMIIELFSWIAYLIINLHLSVLNIIISLSLIGIWLSTIIIQIPQHEKLNTTYTYQQINELVSKNWIRTILWSIKSIALLLL